MHNDNEKYLEQINVHKDAILANDQKLIADYENCRHLYERIINQYESQTIRLCTQVVAYVTGESIINWRIALLDGTVVYSSDNKIQFEEWHLDISTLGLEEGTQFRLQAYMATNGYNSDDILEYAPYTNTVYYFFNQVKELRNVLYLDMITSPESPPILKCASIAAYNEALVITKYEIRLVSTGKSIYTSGKYKKKDIWNKNLSELNIDPGTQLILHSGVVAGSDSEPYAIIEYTDNGITGNFKLDGNAFKTLFMYI